MARRRRRSYEKKKPVAAASIGTSIVGLICFLIAAVLVVLAASELDFGKLTGIIGVITMLISMMAFGVGARTARENDHDFLSRVIGVVVPAVSSVVLLSIYFLGILFG